jgi:hypothetical protein
MTEEERARVQQHARDMAAHFSYDDGSLGRVLEVRKARNPAHYPDSKKSRV